MSYDKPTAAEFKTRFPIFDDKDDAFVTAILNEASASVDETWLEADYKPAIMYLAAHMIATENSDEGGSIEVGGAGAGAIASESFGPISVSYRDAGTSDAVKKAGIYGSTIYGQRFAALLRRNKPAIFAV